MEDDKEMDIEFQKLLPYIRRMNGNLAALNIFFREELGLPQEIRMNLLKRINKINSEEMKRNV